jgi:molybdenum cofactor cytidylyltransferase
MLAQLPAALAAARHVLAVGCVVPASDRVDGLSFETLRAIAGLPEVDFLLVEADGSRERPLKAPAPHEPALPPCATLVVPVVGLDVLGKPLAPAYVHRPELVAALARCAPDAPVTPAVVAAVTRHPQGGCKNVPPGAAVIPFLNKADLLARPAPALEAAKAMLEAEWIERVLIGAAATAQPLREVVRV